MTNAANKTYRVRNLTTKMMDEVHRLVENGYLNPSKTGKTFVDLTLDEVYMLFDSAEYYRSKDVCLWADWCETLAQAQFTMRRDYDSADALENRCLEALTVLNSWDVEGATWGMRVQVSRDGERFEFWYKDVKTSHSLATCCSDLDRVAAHLAGFKVSDSDKERQREFVAERRKFFNRDLDTMRDMFADNYYL